MKCYTLDYDISQRAPKTVFVSRNSSFQIGIKVLDGDNQVDVDYIEFTDHTVNPEDTRLAGYQVFSLTSGDEPKSEDARVAVTLGEGDAQHAVFMPLQLVTTSSTVAEVTSSGPAYESVTFSGEYVDGTSFSYELLKK